MITVGIGRWDKNLIREFDKICSVKYCCNRGNSKNIEWLKNRRMKIDIKYILDFHNS